jgi:hypothetical protein
LSSVKFCMLRAPICTTSAYSATACAPSSSSASVTIARPVASRALASSSSPARPSPWNAYGDDRGLYAPPRSATAPAALTACADARICASLSTEHGPAITGTSGPPKRTPGATSTTVFSGRHSRDTCLYGLLTYSTCATPSIPAMCEPSTCPSLPMSPTAVRCAPGIGTGSKPIARMAPHTSSTWRVVAPACITTSMPVPRN